MDDFKAQLASLIAEGSSIVQSIETSSFIISLGKAVAPHVLEEEDLEKFEYLIETLDLPSPVHQVYIRYIKWNRDCESFFASYELDKCFQFKEFVGLRKEVGKEICKRSPRQRVMLLRIKEQLSILDSLYKLNIENLRKEAKKQQTIFKALNKRKLTLTLLYVLGCVIFDGFLFPIITLYVIGVVAVEAAVLLGIPRFLEWLSGQ